MLCQDCTKREAQVHLFVINDLGKMNLHLCKECAAARGFHSPLDNMPFPLAELLSGWAQNMPASSSKEDLLLKCPVCGLTFEKFTRQGRFGCGECYKTFRIRLEPIMRKIHGASMHRGKTPSINLSEEKSEVTISIKEEERLEQELKKAIDSEDFERAAEIRDKLKTLREDCPVDK